jgi:large subunit ribosomal protein L7/L12
MTRADVVAYLEGLDALALAELIDELQRRLGLRPVATQRMPMTMGAPLTMGMPIEEPEYSVVIVGHVAAQKIELLRVVRELRPTIGVLEAKRLVESAPVVFGESLSSHQATRMAARLREAGAKVEIR